MSQENVEIVRRDIAARDARPLPPLSQCVRPTAGDNASKRMEVRFRCLHESLGDLPPSEFESLYAPQEVSQISLS
jgi:hypothetical protein